MKDNNVWVAIMQSENIDRFGHTVLIELLKEIVQKDNKNYKLEGNTLYQKVDISNYELKKYE